MILKKFYDEDKSIVEVGVDEVGRGPMFGRVYTAAVILPKNNDFDHTKMKDSKKFSSWKKLLDTAEYIKNNCLAYSISYENEESIDKNNILNATHLAMHDALKKMFNNYNIDSSDNYLILVDGNNFKQLTYFDKNSETIKEYNNVCITGGDNKYSAIAAASILAKVERDLYIEDLCEKYPKLNEYYDLVKNKGYGTKKHIDGNKKHYHTDPVSGKKTFAGSYPASAAKQRHEIPPGDENLYILKSQIVPPVCPACPPVIQGSGCPELNAKCPPCPAPKPVPPCPPCERCPEPQFQCKKSA